MDEDIWASCLERVDTKLYLKRDEILIEINKPKNKIYILRLEKKSHFSLKINNSEEIPTIFLKYAN
jgi:hypothetical protein